MLLSHFTGAAVKVGWYLSTSVRLGTCGVASGVRNFGVVAFGEDDRDDMRAKYSTQHMTHTNAGLYAIGNLDLLSANPTSPTTASYKSIFHPLPKLCLLFSHNQPTCEKPPNEQSHKTFVNAQVINVLARFKM